MAEAIRFGYSLELSYSTVQGHTEVFQDGFHSKQAIQGSIKEVESGAEAGFKKQTHECASIALEVAEVDGQLVSAQTIHNTLQQVSLHDRRPRRKPFLKLAHKKACKQFAEDNLAKSMTYWNHVLWSDESKVNLFDSDGVQHVWRRPGEEYQETSALPTVKHDGGSIMVWGCMSTAGSGELRFIEGNMDSNMYCDILNQKMMPFLQKLFFNITTPNTPPRWQLKVMDWPSLSPDLNPIEHMWGILKRKVEKHHVCNIQQLRDVIMEEWKRTPVTRCAALVTSMSRRIKAVLDNSGAPTKYWHFRHSFDMFT